MKRFYALMLAMVLIVSSFVFSACSSKDGGTEQGNGTASEQTQQHNNDGTDNTVTENDTKENPDKDNKNVVEELGDDVERTVDDALDAGQR